MSENLLDETSDAQLLRELADENPDVWTEEVCERLRAIALKLETLLGVPV